MGIWKTGRTLSSCTEFENLTSGDMNVGRMHHKSVVSNVNVMSLVCVVSSCVCWITHASMPLYGTLLFILTCSPYLQCCTERLEQRFTFV